MSRHFSKMSRKFNQINHFTGPVQAENENKPGARADAISSIKQQVNFFPFNQLCKTLKDQVRKFFEMTHKTFKIHMI